MQASDQEIEAIILIKKMFKNANTDIPTFLNWVADRFVHVHGDSEHVDFVHALRDRARQLEVIAKLLECNR